LDPQKYSKWRGKYKTLKDYYEQKYHEKYYEFDKYQLEVNPDESDDDIEAYDAQRQQREIIKCTMSFAYFCHKYIKILHPVEGLIPFILYKYQCDVIRNYENHSFNIISKFRQGGLTTVTLLWGMWRCMFKLDQQVMLLSKTDREATDIGMIVDRAIEHLPPWLKPRQDLGKWNDHLKQFKETGGSMKFYSPEAARGKSVTFLIIDEAAFIPDMETHWKAMWPVLSTGGACAVVSTVNGFGNWYHQTFMDTKEGRNKIWHVIELDYWTHPQYDDEEWVKKNKAQLGEAGWLQEVMREFLGSGDNYFPTKIIDALDKATRDNYPIRKLFPKWANIDKYLELVNDDMEFDKGAMWIWKEPVDGHEYLIGVDVAEGMGEKGDNSCFQVIDTATLEQVAEFYSNSVPPHILGQILNEVGLYYNTATVIVENMAPGGAVISQLQHDLFYENIHYEARGKQEKAGITVTRTNRPIFLERLQHRLINSSVRINSSRFVRELGTFIFNPQTKRAEALKGHHDDAIMAMCMALFVRDGLLRDIPMGAEVPKEITATFKTEIYEEIKRELQQGAPQDFIEEPTDLLAPDKDDILPGVMFNYQRKYDKLLREFGW